MNPFAAPGKAEAMGRVLRALLEGQKMGLERRDIIDEMARREQQQAFENQMAQGSLEVARQREQRELSADEEANRRYVQAQSEAAGRAARIKALLTTPPPSPPTPMESFSSYLMGIGGLPGLGRTAPSDPNEERNRMGALLGELLPGASEPGQADLLRSYFSIKPAGVQVAEAKENLPSTQALTQLTLAQIDNLKKNAALKEEAFASGQADKMRKAAAGLREEARKWAESYYSYDLASSQEVANKLLADANELEAKISAAPAAKGAMNVTAPGTMKPVMWKPPANIGPPGSAVPSSLRVEGAPKGGTKAREIAQRAEETRKAKSTPTYGQLHPEAGGGGKAGKDYRITPAQKATRLVALTQKAADVKADAFTMDEDKAQVLAILKAEYDKVAAMPEAGSLQNTARGGALKTQTQPTSARAFLAQKGPKLFVMTYRKKGASDEDLRSAMKAAKVSPGKIEQALAQKR